MKRAMEKATSGPSGMLLYHPTREFSFGKLLGVEFATELLEAILVVFLLSQTKIESFAGRVGFVLLAGILAAITTNIPYWNWYGFPRNYTTAYMFIEIIGFLCVGLIAGLLLKNRSPASATS
jgi:glycerol-3-phosphate acyltransferase PlsY